MKVVVVGSGLMGVTTAYFLRCEGHEVTVLDRAEGAGRETSFANGGLLTPSMADPWNSPGCWRTLLSSLVRSDSAMQLRLMALPTLIGWGVQFLRNSTAKAYRRNLRSNLSLAIYSGEMMDFLRQQLRIEYGRSSRGTLRIFRSDASLHRAVRAADDLRSEGLTYRRLAASDAVALEPALAPIASQLAGAIHYQTDEAGDARRFCGALAEYAAEAGVSFRYRTEVSKIEVHSGRVAAVVSGAERFVADRYVIAAGSYSTPLLRSAGIRLPVRPAKGYSLTFKCPKEAPLQVPIVDDQLHAAVVPFEGAIRVAGTAEFAGYDLAVQEVRVRRLFQLLQEVLPRTGFDFESGQPWCGLRPMSVDGVPILGAAGVEDLYLNTGHGHLGWTMAAGSGRLLADLICGRSTAIDAGRYSIARFQ